MGNIEVRKLNRQSVRALAEKNSAELFEIAKAGGNVYQRSLEQLDERDEFLATLSVDESIAFLTMYTEELNACTLKTEDDTNVMLAKMQAEDKARATIGIIGLLLLLFVLFLVFK